MRFRCALPDLLAAAGHLHVVGDDLTMYRHVLARWWDAHRAGLELPMVDRRNSTRRQLNRLADLLRQTNGELGGDEIVASGDRRFAVGDRVTARAPTMTSTSPATATPMSATARSAPSSPSPATRGAPSATRSPSTSAASAASTSPDRFDHHPTAAGRAEVGVDHAYALTSYAVQGSTHPVSTSRVDATATRAETYVDITRGRSENHLSLTATTDPLDGEALPRAPAPPADLAVADRLHRSTGELTAWELAHPGEMGVGPCDRPVRAQMIREVRDRERLVRSRPRTPRPP